MARKRGWCCCFFLAGEGGWYPNAHYEIPETGFFFKYSCSTSACNLIKKETWHRCFLVSFTKFLRQSFLSTSTDNYFRQLWMFTTTMKVYYNYECFYRQLWMFLTLVIKRNLHFSSFWGLFMENSWNFRRSLSFMVLEFSLPSEHKCKETAFSRKLFFFFFP